MLTGNQKEAFRKIKEEIKVEDGGLTPKQKGDFYYRMSKILKDELEGLTDLVHLIDNIPISYLDNKIDFKQTAISAMELTEKIIEKINPALITTNEKGEAEVERYLKIDLADSLPGLTNSMNNYKIRYKPTDEDVIFQNRINWHRQKVWPIKVDKHIYSLKEFGEVVLPAIRAKDSNFQAMPGAVLGYMSEEEFSDEPKDLDPRIVNKLRNMHKEKGIPSPGKITLLPDRPKLNPVEPPGKGDKEKRRRRKPKREEPK